MVGTVLAQLRAARVFGLFLAVTVLLLPVQAVAVKARLPIRKQIPHRYFRVVCRLIGIRVVVRGDPVRHQPVLIASNHSSWLDIPVMNSVGPMSFIAKREVGGWPFFGLLAKLAETVFVDRERRTRTMESRNEIHTRLSEGDTLVLYPEGTSSDGNRVLNFKSALMSVAQLGIVNGPEDLEDPVLVQPVSVAYTHLHGLPMGRQFRPYFAWYGDMELFPHLWEAFSMGPIDVVIEFHPPVTIADVGNRKRLASYCQDQVAKGVAAAITGRQSGGGAAGQGKAEPGAAPGKMAAA